MSYIATYVRYKAASNEPNGRTLLKVFPFRMTLSYNNRHLLFFRLDTASAVPQGCILFYRTHYIVDLSPNNNRATIEEYYKECVTKLFENHAPSEALCKFIPLKLSSDIADIKKQLPFSKPLVESADFKRFLRKIRGLPTDTNVCLEIVSYHDSCNVSYQRLQVRLPTFIQSIRKEISERMALEALRLLTLHTYTHDRALTTEDYRKLRRAVIKYTEDYHSLLKEHENFVQRDKVTLRK